MQDHQPARKQHNLALIVPLYGFVSLVLASLTGNYNDSFLWAQQSTPGDVPFTCVAQFGVEKFGDFISQYCQAQSSTPFYLEFPSARPPFINSLLWTLSLIGSPIVTFALFGIACFGSWVVAITKATTLSRYSAFCLSLPSAFFAFDRGNVVYILHAALAIGLSSSVLQQLQHRARSGKRLVIISVFLSLNLSLSITSLALLCVVAAIPFKRLCLVAVQTTLIWGVLNIVLPTGLSQLGGPSSSGFFGLVKYSKVATGVTGREVNLYSIAFADWFRTIFGEDSEFLLLICLTVFFAIPVAYVAVFRGNGFGHQSASDDELHALSLCVAASLFQVVLSGSPYQSMVSISLVLTAFYLCRRSPQQTMILRTQCLILVFFSLGIQRHIQNIGGVLDTLGSTIMIIFSIGLWCAPLCLMLVLMTQNRTPQNLATP